MSWTARLAELDLAPITPNTVTVPADGTWQEQFQAVADAVNSGAVTWDEKLVITEQGKEVGSAGFDDLQPGAEITV